MKPDRVTIGFTMRGWKEIANIEFTSAQIIGARFKELTGQPVYWWNEKTSAWVETSTQYI